MNREFSFTLLFCIISLLLVSCSSPLSIHTPLFSRDSGIFTEPFDLVLNFDSDQTAYYTLDGSVSGSNTCRCFLRLPMRMGISIAKRHIFIVCPLIFGIILLIQIPYRLFQLAISPIFSIVILLVGMATIGKPQQVSYPKEWLYVFSYIEERQRLAL